MDFRTYLIKKVWIGFFIIYTWISLAMMVIGLLYDPDQTFGYELFFSPLLFSLVATVPTLIEYSAVELSIKQVIIRKLLHLCCLEILIMSILILANIVNTVDIGVSLGLSIVIIDVTVNLVLWINDKKTADDLNDSIKALKNRYRK